MEDYDALDAALQPLREAGLRIAVDDAGAGYATFRHILRLEPDLIKLDRSLISGIDDAPARWALAGAVVALETRSPDSRQPRGQSNSTGSPSSHPTAADRPQSGQVSHVTCSLTDDPSDSNVCGRRDRGARQRLFRSPGSVRS